ncbi:unnamed protein product [Amoebophrya sp. A120]|nr:unnamed protein product [Amoebophrya sp. A120]|eukprot:GSA120T00019825001.1
MTAGGGPRLIPKVHTHRIAKARSANDVVNQTSQASARGPLPQHDQHQDPTNYQLDRTTSSLKDSNPMNNSCLPQNPNSYLQMGHQHFDYTDEWPEVEVTVHVLDCSGLNLALSSFDLDFVVILDWLDFQLVENEHFGYDTRNGRFHLLESVLHDPDFFNPTVRVDNGVAIELIDGDSDKFPKIKRLLSTTKPNGLQGNCEVPWLSKCLRFKGTLVCMDIDAAWFPLDVLKLRIRLVSDFLKGTTSMGRRRRVKLIDPLLRVAYKNSSSNNNSSKYTAKWSRKISPHSWPSNAMTLGEMCVTGFGGCDCEDIAYQFDILLTRRWKRYWFDFLIQGLQVVSAAFSLYVPFSYDAGSDTLPNRLSITLTVILTLVAFTIERPSVIESLPYPTLHDQYERIMVAIVALVGIENVIVFQTCIGAFPKYFSDPYNNDAPLPDPPELCRVGFCGASNIDCLCFVSVVTAVVLVSLVLLFWGQFYRIREVLRVHRSLHEFEWESFTRMSDHCVRMCQTFEGFDKKIWRRQICEISAVDAQMLRVRPDFVKRTEQNYNNSGSSSMNHGMNSLTNDVTFDDLPESAEEENNNNFMSTSSKYQLSGAVANAMGTMDNTDRISNNLEWYTWNSPQALHFSNGLEVMPGDAIRMLNPAEEADYRRKEKNKSRPSQQGFFQRSLTSLATGYLSTGNNETPEKKSKSKKKNADSSPAKIKRRKSSSSAVWAVGNKVDSSSDVVIVNQEDSPNSQSSVLVEIRSLNHERLILCGTEALFPEEMRDLEDIVEAVSIVPFSKYFAQSWLKWVLSKERQSFLSKCELQAAVKELARIEDDVEYNRKKQALMKNSRLSVISLDHTAGLGCATHPRFLDSSASHLDNLDDENSDPSRKKVTLGDPHDQVYVVDVGTGEIGFYVFWRDSETEEVRSKVFPKWSYPSKSDFVRTFFKAGSGKRQFAQLLMENFELEPSGLMSMTMTSGMNMMMPKVNSRPSQVIAKEPSLPVINVVKPKEDTMTVEDFDKDVKDNSTKTKISNKDQHDKSNSVPGFVVDLTKDEASAADSPDDGPEIEHSTSTEIGQQTGAANSSASESVSVSEQENLQNAAGVVVLPGGSQKRSSQGIVLPPVFPQAGLAPAVIETPAVVSKEHNSQPTISVLEQSQSFPTGIFSGTGQQQQNSTSSSRVRIYIGFTGRNRDYLLNHPDEKEDLDQWLQGVQRLLRDEFRIDQLVGRLNFLDFLSTRMGAKTEAAYELTATQFLLQNGDLDMDLINIPKGPKDTRFAFLELKSCIESIFADGPERNRLSFWREKYLHEFKDFGMERSDLEHLWLIALEKTGFETPTTPKDRERLILSLLQSLLDEPMFLRAMTRARLFCGTLSAGGGSCQVTCQPQAGRTEVTYGSIPFGNRTSYSGSEGVYGLCNPVWDKHCSTVTTEMLHDWAKIIKQAIEDSKLPKDVRGLFVGISAIYHAAAACKCDNKILPKAEFLSRLSQQLELEVLRTSVGNKTTSVMKSPLTAVVQQQTDNTLKKPATSNLNPNSLSEKELRNISNLQLVHTFVSEVLHESAFIVCKRNWKVAGEDYVATWSFGFWLTSVRQKSFRKQGSNLSEISSSTAQAG